MECSVIVVTHGNLACELINTTNMLIGSQKHVLTVDFMPGENLESLIKKLAVIISDISEDIPLLLLVDIHSGTPFNASSYFVKHRQDTRLIAGVNIPMLVNILLERQDVSSLEELVTLSVNVGKSAIKPL
ncbi:PTS system mannose-specific IIB component [Raoultella sp. BIGb0138]|uniref:mannose/fructose/sorbose PTS transporter subunit IIA n=1 Tax=Raoultella sp. BIGb0138 TaxID=2485115 RepID=UPI00104C20FF|nr:mannose/fructose/sorbose PTS transporter subunit IIA [Raoultella sp. BIGb0138]TCW17996.1 PTS system mannose-specific IIB component [Raoultella sp. BIGb0138]